MKHSPFPDTPTRPLRPVERAFVTMVRQWRAGADGQQIVWNDLAVRLGPARALETLLQLIDTHGWRALDILDPDAPAFSADEADLARLVMMATEQDRESALAEACFVVRPAVLLQLLIAAERVGLPLLCADCRARVAGQTGFFDRPP
ncbi:hypothetical protein [Aestuariicoccus sp. MJ-SS9]|uniref:hypothetical protein n=1 Tax=Aestuariicoccus sp. MJ-SS9 TaxID=3079855 RepID=UPI002914E75A|nr:hypothetical protein [Aestuariicoccus sp. MJ-SS9]MDU8912740.1 hypothetical protein [Aestuariicoccus sp. MJ-SS9]